LGAYNYTRLSQKCRNGLVLGLKLILKVNAKLESIGGKKNGKRIK